MYRIDLHDPAILVPCTFVPSKANPQCTLSVNEDGSTIVVEPDGSQTRTVPQGDPNWDSPWTQGTLMDGFLVYRSATDQTPGVPRGYKVLGL